MDKTWDNFRMIIDLEYNKLQEENNLNATESGFQNANHAAEEQQYFASTLDNLALADLSDKDVMPLKKQ